LPNNPIDPRIGSGLPFTSVGAFYYDAAERRYVGPVSSLEVGKGYFFFSETDTTVINEGEPVNPLVVELSPGWNLLPTGSKRINAASIAGRSSLIPQFYKFDPAARRYIAVTRTLEPDGAYWILALDHLVFNLIDGSISLGKRSTGVPHLTTEFSSEPPGLPEDRIVNETLDLNGLILHTGNPNPFNSTTSVSFTLPGESYVTVRVFDVSGRLVSRLLDDNMTTGTHSLSWEAPAASPSGIYMLRVETKYGSATQKLLLAR
jgi:hypothetical protein